MSRRGSARRRRAAPVASDQPPEQRGGEHEADGEQRPDRRALLVGELAEDPHGAEGDGGGEAEQGTDGAWRSILPGQKRQERFGLLTYIR